MGSFRDAASGGELGFGGMTGVEATAFFETCAVAWNPPSNMAATITAPNMFMSAFSNKGLFQTGCLGTPSSHGASS